MPRTGLDDLVDDFRLLVYPVLLGSGKGLFRDGHASTLSLVDATTFSSGVIGLRYSKA